LKLDDYPTVVRDMYDAIFNDKYMWICVWGEPRLGKSTLALLLLYWIYKDWQKVLNAVAFSLNQVLYKIKNGIPETWPTKNDLHRRIPALLWDDFGAHSNKAKTQFSMAWNYFKGGFDILGTKIGVLMATMVQPSEPTQQIAEKYTHELWVSSRGHYKYDRWRQQQDYKGFRARGSKEWLDEQDFDEIPNEVFKTYDEMRQALADEVLVAIEDVIAETEVDTVLKRLQTSDVTFMKRILERGPISEYLLRKDMGSEGRLIVTRLKARNLVIPVEVSKDNYSYDLTDLGLEVLKTVKNGSYYGMRQETVNQQYQFNQELTGIRSEEKALFNALADKLSLKKNIAQIFQFQGYRVTESYSSDEPDLVIWKDALTPREIVSVQKTEKTSFDVATECRKEVAYASKFGFSQIHLIVFDKENNKIFDDLVKFDQKISIPDKNFHSPDAFKLET